MRRALLSLSAFSALWLSACYPPEAGIELTVTSDPALALDQLSVRLISTSFSSEPVLVPEDARALGESETIGLLVKQPGLIGTDVTVRVEGLSGGVAFAAGEVGVRPENRQIVDAEVALAALFVCGDGSVDPREECDDGDSGNGDGCDADCAIEPGFVCSGEPSLCARCGDGAVTPPEECDDGGGANGDGCAQDCTVEGGYVCAGAPSACETVCGDGIVIGAEQCDDDGIENGDGCSAACAPEPGYACSGEPSVCAPVCGDGVIIAPETCDDDNQTNADGCSAACAPEPGYACSGEPSVCAPVCGDGVIIAPETCDDNNLSDADGCSAACAPELGFACVGEPSSCGPVCGDGLIIAPETCDDDNASDGDGCSAACAPEPGFQCSGAPSVCDTVCGDEIIAGDEECDDGSLNSDIAPDACRTTCELPDCGDTVTDSGEECDDGNLDNRDGCVTGCFLPSCGDGFINGADACDDANANAADGCTACTIDLLSECAGEPSVCALAADFFVVDQGGGGDFTTIQQAINGTNDGDVIAIRSGTYTDSVIVANDLTFVGDGVVVIEGAGGDPTIGVPPGSAVTLQGVTVRHPNNQSAVRVENNGSVAIIGATLGPSGKNGLESANSTTTVVRRSVIAGNSGGGLNLDGTWTVENSALVGNGGAQVDGGGARFRVAGTFRFNTVTGNVGGNEGGIRCQQPTAIESSIVFNNAGAQQTSAACNLATSTTADPGLEADGFHLVEDSPVIDSGPAAGCPATDIDGDRRPLGAACELGADERP